MLTSEELFPPEYCFAGGCSSHLARSSFPFLFASVPPSCRFPPSSFPPSLFLPCLLHDDIVLTRLGTCNLFVSLHGEIERAVCTLGRCIRVLRSFFLSRFSSVRSQNPFYLFATAHPLIRVYIRAASLLSRRRVECAPARNNIFLFFFFF